MSLTQSFRKLAYRGYRGLHSRGYRLRVFVSRHVREATLATYHAAWPIIWRLTALIYAVLPSGTWPERAFRHVVFTRPWRTFHRRAYITELRDRYFEYIATFFYNYPIRKGHVIVQLGASYGDETARLARAVGKKGRVIAVEPAPENQASLRARFEDGKHPQVTVVPMGAWNAPGELRFLLGGEREHRLADLNAEHLSYEWWGVSDHLDEHRYRGSTVVRVDTVENIARAHGLDRIDFVLVETNGSELEVVQGIGAMLPHTRRIGARGHVERDGVPIHLAIAEFLQANGFSTKTNDEGMVLARRNRAATTSSEPAKTEVANAEQPAARAA